MTSNRAPERPRELYSINFEHMPELGWTLGYPFALLLMVGTAGGLWILFKKSGWF